MHDRGAIADTVKAMTNEVKAAFDQMDVDRAFGYYRDADGNSIKLG